MIVDLHRYRHVPRRHIIRIDPVVSNTVEHEIGGGVEAECRYGAFLGGRRLTSVDAALVKRGAALVPEAEGGDPAGVAGRAAAKGFAVHNAVPEAFDASGGRVVEGSDKVPADRNEEVVEFCRFHAEGGDFDEGEEQGLPVGALAKESYGGETAHEMGGVGEVLLQRAHHDNGGDDLVRRRRGREGLHDPIAQSDVDHILSKQVVYLLRENGPVIAFHAPVFFDYELLLSVMRYQSPAEFFRVCVDVEV